MALKKHDHPKLWASALKLLGRHSWPQGLHPTLKSLVRVAAADATVAAAVLLAADAVHNAAARTATVQSDYYAAQIQTKRSPTATCARSERHNCIVSLVGY